MLKLHPLDSPRHYEDSQIKIMLGQTPWELILLNHLKSNKIKNKNLMSISSTALAYTLMFFNKILEEKNIKCIFLWELFPTPFNKSAESFYNTIENF